MPEINVVIPRASRDERTFAVVKAAVEDGFSDEEEGPPAHELFAALSQAVTQWCRRTKQGRSVLDSNNGDFNVGDLQEWAEEADLLRFLRSSGIHRLKIDAYCDDSRHAWEFDDNLYDEQQEED